MIVLRAIVQLEHLEIISLDNARMPKEYSRCIKKDPLKEFLEPLCLKFKSLPLFQLWERKAAAKYSIFS